MRPLNRQLLKINLVFIFVFLNIWDFVINRDFLNAMVLGFVMFGPTALFWWVGNIRSIILITLISILEFVLMFIFFVEGLELSGLAMTLKSIFWMPYIILAAYNLYWGLRIYSKQEKEFLQKK